jgi:DNA-binding response OmpR family regulator
LGTDRSLYVCGCLLLILCIGITAAAAPASADYEKILQLRLGYSNGEYQVLTREITYGRPPNLAILSGPLRGVITGRNGHELEVFSLSEPGTAMGEGILRSPENSLAPYTEHYASGEMDLVLPVLPGMERVSLYDTRTGNLLVSLDTGPVFSEFCSGYPRDPGCLAREPAAADDGPVPGLRQLLAGVFLSSVVIAISVLYLVKRRGSPSPAPAGKQTVLIVDDSPDIVAMVSYALTRAGYSCITASGGQECLDILTVRKPDVILLDVVMEPLDGWSTLKQIKKNPDTKKIPVLMLTGNCLTAGEARQYHICIEDYVMKPFREEELFAAIGQILARKKTFRDSLPIAEKAGVDREKFCRLAALSVRVSADRKIISILERPDRDLQMPGITDPETRQVISEMIRNTRSEEVQMEELRHEIQQAFTRKGFVPPSW